MRVLHRPIPGEALLTRPVDTAARRTAPPWPGREADREISFDDVRALPEPVWASDDVPLELTDWSARLADDWTYIADRFDNLADGVACDLTQVRASLQYGTHCKTAPLLSELAELKAVQLVNWRQALRVHAEDELALYDTKAQVA